jgi:hypothetical protein
VVILETSLKVEIVLVDWVNYFEYLRGSNNFERNEENGEIGDEGNDE